jgi:hypothetical protein
MSEQNAEIQIVCKNDSLIFPRPSQDLIIRSGSVAYRRPMQGIKPILSQERNPIRRKIHVDYKLHAEPRGTSCSSARQAAYDNASRMSSSAR